MAKAKEGVAISGAAYTLYRTTGEMPWDQIEQQVGVTFDTKDREEIWRCTWPYFVHLSVEESRVPIGEVKALRRKIAQAAKVLLDVTERFRSARGRSPSDQDEDLFLAVAFSSRKQNFDLTTLLRSVAPACQDLVDGLSESAVSNEISRFEPESVALAHFIAAVVAGAKKKPARRNAGFNTVPSSFEYQRWGMALGPSVPKTAELAQAVLERHVSPQQVKSAFELARQLHLFV
jgi:hypothetical protein